MLRAINFFGPIVLLLNAVYFTIKIGIELANDECTYPQYEILLLAVEFGFILVIILWILALLTARRSLMKPYLFYISVLMYWYFFVVVQNLLACFMEAQLPWYKAAGHVFIYACILVSGVSAITYYEKNNC